MLPHITKIGTHLPSLVTPVKPAAVFPTEVYVTGNKNRVDWIKRFVGEVHSHSTVAGELTLEDKIERLQRRLGGRPLQIEENLRRLDHGQADEKVERMKKDLLQAR